MEIPRINSFLQAYATFQDVLEKPYETDSFFRDAAIQRFEYTIDAGWKALKEILAEKFAIEVASPVAAFREAFAQKIISKNDDWVRMVKARNKTSHIYNEKNAIKTVSAFKKYNTLLHELAETLRVYEKTN